MFEFFGGAILTAILKYAKQLPKPIAWLLLAIPLIFFGGFALLFAYGTVSGLLDGNFPLAGLSFVVFGLFVAVILVCVDAILSLDGQERPYFKKIIKLLVALLALLFVAGFLILMIVDTFVENVTTEMNLLQRILMFSFAILGVVGFSIRTINAIKALHES